MEQFLFATDGSRVFVQWKSNRVFVVFSFYFKVHNAEEFNFNMSSPSSFPNGNDDKLQPAPKKVKVIYCKQYCFSNNGSGGQTINAPSPANLSFVFTSSLAVRPVMAHMLRPSAPPGPVLQRQISLYNQRMQSNCLRTSCSVYNKGIHHYCNKHCLGNIRLYINSNHRYNDVFSNVSLDENLKLLNRGVSTEQEAVCADPFGNLVKRYIPMEFSISLDNFPYYLSERTKHHLVASYFLHLNREGQPRRPNPERGENRVFLSGPEGSDVYLDVLAVALSCHFGVKLLVFDCQENESVLSMQPSNDVLRFHMHPTLEYLSTRPLSNSINTQSFSCSTSESLVSHIPPPPFYRKSQSRAFKIGDRVIFTGLRLSAFYSDFFVYSGPSFGYRGKVLVMNSTSGELGVRFDLPISDGVDLGGLCETDYGFYCDGNEVCIDVEDVIKPIFTPIQGFCAEDRLIVFVKHTENCMMGNYEGFPGIITMVNRLPYNVFVIGSHIQQDCTKQKLFNIHRMRTLLRLFPDKISIEMPEDKKLLDKLKSQLIRDSQLLKAGENVATLKRVLTESKLEWEDIDTLQLTDLDLTDDNADKVVKWALGRQLMAHHGYYSDLKLVISRESIVYGLNYLRAVQTNNSRVDQEVIQGSQRQDIPTSDAFEERILEDTILHNDIGIKFDDIGALDNIKDSLKEIAILPLKRPGLFRKGQLRKLCRGILLFGPPGTGKTMLAKAVAAEAGATFFNISASISKWNEDPHKFVKALSSLASKMAPSILFIDEADSLFEERSFPGLVMMDKMKNDFMLYWDGLHSKDTEMVIVLAATNRPFDLHESFIRSVPRRFMVNLPDTPSRSMILKVILEGEDLAEDVDFDEIAQMTNGFSGNDLKNLCIAAAHCPITEIVLKDKLKSPVVEEEEDAEIRPLNMRDFKDAFEQVKGCSTNGLNSMADILQWNPDGGGSNSEENTMISYYI
ncbi:hypothetical protein ACS0TY_000423 [Phlomoides rotata]